MKSVRKITAQSRNMRRSPIPFVVGLGLLVAGSLFYSLLMGTHIAERYTPLADAVMEIKIEVILGHLWFERSISEDKDENIAIALEHLDQAAWYVRAMLEGGENSKGTYIPLQDPALRKAIGEMQDKLLRFRAITKKQQAMTDPSVIASDIEQHFGAFLENCLRQADNVETTLQASIKKNLHRFRTLHELLILLCVLLTAFIGGILHRYERRQMLGMAALRESKENLRATLDSIGDAVVVTNSDGAITRMNPVAERLTGWMLEKAQGKPLLSVLSLVNVETTNPIKNVLKGHQSMTPLSYTTLISKDGSEYQISDSAAPILDDEGTAIGVVLVFRDVTEECKVREALLKNEERLDLAMAVANDGMWDWDLTTDIVYFDPRYYTMAGYEPNEFPGSFDAWSERVHPDDFTQTEASVRSHLAGKNPRYDVQFRFRRKDGEWMWIRARGKVVARDESDTPLRMIGTHADITERKRAEEERERLMSAIEQAAETVVITDAEGEIQYVNPSFERITGYTRNEAIGQNPRILKSDEHDDTFYTTMWDTLIRGETWTGRFINKKKDGTLYTEEARISPVFDASGKTINYVAVQRDITKEIKLEGQLHQAQKMEAVGQLAGGIAHDFNNLLQVILGYGDIVLEEVEAGDTIREPVEEILKASKRARTLVQQLLAFSRRQVLEMKDIDLNETIADLMKMIRRVIGEHITLEVLTGHDLGTVHADPTQITQILMNLCVNARDAMPSGGTIIIETENVRIDETYCQSHLWARPGRYALLSVTDTGCGMDKEILDQVFDPFFTTKGVGEGTGLGLAMVYGLVKQHQGLAHIYSELGKGTTFKIYLPLVERAAVSVGAKIEGPVPGGTETILLAEDDASVRRLSELFLESAGYTVLSTSNGEEAWRIFEEHTDEIELALLDVVMPKLGGRAVFERIHETRPKMPVLFTSGYSMNAIHTSFALDEGLQLIQKPCQRSDLLRRVREVLDKNKNDTA